MNCLLGEGDKLLRCMVFHPVSSASRKSDKKSDKPCKDRKKALSDVIITTTPTIIINN